MPNNFHRYEPPAKVKKVHYIFLRFDAFCKVGWYLVNMILDGSPMRQGQANMVTEGKTFLPSVYRDMFITNQPPMYLTSGVIKFRHTLGTDKVQSSDACRASIFLKRICP